MHDRSSFTDQGVHYPVIDLRFEPDALQRMKTYALIAGKSEIGGWGFVEKREVPGLDEPQFVCYHVMIYEQEASGGGVQFDPMQMFDYIRENNLDKNHLRLSFHTHGTGDPFWSGTDTSWISDMGEKNGFPWLFSLVSNCWFDQYRIRFDTFEPVRFATSRVRLVEQVDNELVQELYDEVKQKLKPMFINKKKDRNKPKVTIVKEHGQVIVREGTDLDRDDISEEEAARLMADVGDEVVTMKDADEIPEVDIVHGEPVEWDDPSIIGQFDIDDEQQDAILQEIEQDGHVTVCSECNRPRAQVGGMACSVSEDGRHVWIHVRATTESAS